MGQSKKITIKDSVTGEVIPDVNVQYVNSNEGTISNMDSMVNLMSKDSITLSHLAYETKKIGYVDYSTANIIYLESGEIMLNEVVVSNFDLKEKLKFVLENYGDLYVAGEKSYTGTYKETFRTNDSLMRLFQVQMEWWNADYELVFEKSWTKQNQIQFIATDYTKLEGLEGDFQISIKNGDFLKSLFLNHYLYYLIYESKKFDIQTLENQGDDTKVVFNAPVEVNGVVVGEYENCEVYLDNATGAVLKLKTTYIDRVDKTLETTKFPSGKRGFTKTTSVTREISFVASDNKLRLNKMQLRLMADIEIEGVVTPMIQEQSVYFTKVLEGKIIPNKTSINLNRDFFYESLPELKSSNPVILLTAEEMNFIGE